MKFFKKHLKESICLIIFIVIILICLITFLLMWFGSNGDKYGNRLLGIKDVPISSAYLGDIDKAVKEKDFVTKVTSSVEGKLINFIITVNDDTNVNDAKSVANIVKENFTDEELEFYDIQIFLLDSKSGEESSYPYIGYKHKTSDNFVWSNN